MVGATLRTRPFSAAFYGPGRRGCFIAALRISGRAVCMVGFIPFTLAAIRRNGLLNCSMRGQLSHAVCLSLYGVGSDVTLIHLLLTWACLPRLHELPAVGCYGTGWAAVTH